MRQRVGGVETGKKVVEAAGAVLAEKGFRDATVVYICKRAKTNTISVNYHLTPCWR